MGAERKGGWWRTGCQEGSTFFQAGFEGGEGVLESVQKPVEFVGLCSHHQLAISMIIDVHESIHDNSIEMSCDRAGSYQSILLLDLQVSSRRWSRPYCGRHVSMLPAPRPTAESRDMTPAAFLCSLPLTTPRTANLGSLKIVMHDSCSLPQANSTRGVKPKKMARNGSLLKGVVRGLPDWTSDRLRIALSWLAIWKR
jgi:hypothetical protein